MGSSQAQVPSLSIALFDAGGRKLKLDGDRGVVDVDPVAVEVVAQPDSGRENDDLDLPDVAGEAARGLRMLDLRAHLQCAHGAHISRPRVVVTGLPVIADGIAEELDELGHPPDVILVWMGSDDDRKAVAALRQERRLCECPDKCRQLADGGNIDHQGVASSVTVGGKDDELRVSVTDVNQEVDEILRLTVGEKITRC